MYLSTHALFSVFKSARVQECPNLRVHTQVRVLVFWARVLAPRVESALKCPLVLISKQDPGNWAKSRKIMCNFRTWYKAEL